MKEKTEIRKFYSKLSKAIQNFNLISEGDRILIGVSGGKDSVSLLHGLARLKKYEKTNFEIFAAHIEITSVPYKIDKTYLENFCYENNIKFIFEKIDVDFSERKNKSHCFVCSWHRRKKLFETAHSFNCNKLALGHHLDDAIETLIINMCYHNSISSMPAKLDMFDGKIQLIRPLILLKNEEIKKFASAMNIPAEIETCPFDDKTKRNQAGEIVKEMENRFKFAKNSIFNSMSKIYLKYLPVPENENPIIEDLNVPNKKDKK
ncbi:MAG TPA: tRNA lysidine(34) synthetase TilS [Bacteroidales bacterium]|nr:tRNA lysidine(34) synthetase TilS [Bacteroidales bacterium]HOM37475.1 tRNA lysidine(34) synthetase TilS [Bacteroidales bacterium]HPD24376.1 tRNA lysidine(34) synthetase TilS [Bacteroidales bacterium]HRT00250.1 tRNA lysidine(34) synthetase TilS [Bacteroidales bacterium]HRT80847.1 tRNA lysidine(34) synthetase TilS [Bacteroidales bacterium]